MLFQTLHNICSASPQARLSRMPMYRVVFMLWGGPTVQIPSRRTNDWRSSSETWTWCSSPVCGKTPPVQGFCNTDTQWEKFTWPFGWLACKYLGAPLLDEISGFLRGKLRQEMIKWLVHCRWPWIKELRLLLNPVFISDPMAVMLQN